jgi:hypothetical protein
MQHEDFGEELKKNIPGTETFVATLKARCNDTLCKMIGIYNYVRSNMNWNGSEFIYANQGIRTAWDKKTGNTGEINLILIKLLRDAGVEAKPILFSTRDNGIVNSFYPSESQFNAVMAWVQIAGEYYILNGADKYNSYKLVPEEVAYSKGFLLGEESGSWRNIVKPDQFFKQLVAIEAYIEETGTLKGTATVNSLNYARNPLTKAYLEDKAEFKEMYFVKPYNKITVSQLDVTNAENDTLGLQQKLSFSMPLSSSGNYKYFTINLFSGLTENPFIADERQTDIDFGYPQQFDLYGNYKIPAGYIFDELPKSMMMIMPDTSISFSRYISVEDNALSVRIMLEFSKPFYSAADYDYFKEFYKKLLGKLNEQIVIKKK